MHHFSPTALETYQSCVQKYVYRYEDELYPPNRSEQAQVGHLFHKVMETLLKEKISLVDSKHTLMHAKQLMPELKPPDSLSSQGLDPFFIYQLTTDLISQQIQLEQSWVETTSVSPGIAEAKGTISVGPYKLELRLDRIDRIGDQFVFIDYKTQETPPSWKALYEYELLQPWIYSLYGLETYGADFLGFVYFLPKKPLIRPVLAFSENFHQSMLSFQKIKKKFIEPAQVHDHIAPLKKHITALMDRIKAKDFLCPEPPKSHCRTCSYKPFCHVLLDHHGS